jgi:flagellar basal body-associated protein FliL
MRSHAASIPSAAVLALLAAGWPCPAGAQSPQDAARLQQSVLELQGRNQSLQQALAEANSAEKKTSEQLRQVRERLEALGRNLLDGGSDRLVQATADLQVAGERLRKVEDAASRLRDAVREYTRQAVVSDPDTRTRLETTIRELDAALGVGEKPRPDVRTGSLQQSRIVSIDRESGMIVLNVGESQGARIGMGFRLTRGNQPYGRAVLADVRREICGVFVDSLDNPAETPRPGDLAILETQPAD